MTARRCRLDAGDSRDPIARHAWRLARSRWRPCMRPHAITLRDRVRREATHRRRAPWC